MAFSSPKRSEKTVRMAAAQAKALDAELILLRIVPDPVKVGVVAQLISTDRPYNTATRQVETIVEKLRSEGVNASGMVKIGQVAKGIVSTIKEMQADLLFLGTSGTGTKKLFALAQDPIARYVFDHCPISVCFVRGDINIGSAGTELVGDTTNVVDEVSEEAHAEEIREIIEEQHSENPD
ncbi:MAG: universal stress protein [Candidatus Obscuribacterales bacterium]|nr:universal stress protein [Candidatus Obscuribacterales bacterium]